MNDVMALQSEMESSSDPRFLREQEVLSAVLELMVEEGNRFSMASVAKRASCSKETLYRWYGDRDGLLTATVRWQAAKVIMPRLEVEGVTLDAFRRTLEDFAESWLAVLTSDISIALNRLAVSHAANGESNLGNIVLLNGPLAMRSRLLPIFEIGFSNGFIDRRGEDAFRLLFGLVVADTQIRCLLGEDSEDPKRQNKKFAKEAVSRFIALCKIDQKQRIIEHSDKE